MKNLNKGKELFQIWLTGKELQDLRIRINWTKEGRINGKITDEEYNIELRKIGEIIYNNLENENSSKD